MAAEQTHRSKLEKLDSIIREQEKRLQDLQSTIFHLANYFFVFQGVILTATFNGSSSLRCEDRWLPFTLSLFAATLNLVALGIKRFKYMRTRIELDYNYCERNELVRITEISPGTSSAWTQEPRNCKDPYKTIQRHICFIVCMLLFVGFAAITLFGCWRINCRNNAGTDNCINFCGGGRCLRLCGKIFNG